MSAFLIVDTKISDFEVYEEYKALARPIAESFGGVYRTRGGEMDVRETELWEPTRVVVVEFPDMKSARAFLDSEAYAPIQSIRHNNAECTAFIVDGI